MNKLEMAHEWAKLVGPKTNLPLDILVDNCFDYAEAMLAEYEKRKDKSLPEVLEDDFVIDWKKAPEWAEWWAMDSNGQCLWHKNKPDPSLHEWVIDFNNAGGDCYKYAGKALDFNYQGDWKQSLRKRP